MRDEDFASFSELLDGTCGLLSRGTYRPSATNTALWFRALAAHDLDTVRAGFDAHVRDTERGRFVPTPADVLGQIERSKPRLAHPGGDEAWSLAIAGRSEFDTVVWTDQIRDAFEIARPVLDSGDEVGARMAFRGAYLRLVDAARADGAAPKWTVMIGFDAERRVKAIEAAVKAGRLPQSELLALPAPESGEPLLRLVAPAPNDSAAALEAKAKLRSIAQELRAS
jgi:hypothetical protein